MGFSKASLWGASLILGTIGLSGCGPDPRARLVSQVEGMIQTANEGKHRELEAVMSRPLVEKIRAEGWEPQAALGLVARKDREQAATYRFSDLPRFAAQEYAEVEVIRTSGQGEKRLTVPFYWEVGRWKVGATYQDGRGWEAEDF